MPSTLPTNIETVTVAVSLDIITNELSDVTLEVIGPALMAVLPDGFTEDMISSFEVSETTSNFRRRLNDDSAEATVQVVLKTPLRQVGFTSALELETAVSSSLETAVNDGSFSQNLADECGCSMIVESILVETIYVDPSPEPTISPTKNMQRDRKEGRRGPSSASSGIFIIAGAAIVSCLLIGIGGRYAFKKWTSADAKKGPAQESDLKYLFEDGLSSPPYLTDGGGVELSHFSQSIGDGMMTENQGPNSSSSPFTRNNLL